jgi:hypothetical protein
MEHDCIWMIPEEINSTKIMFLSAFWQLHNARNINVQKIGYAGYGINVHKS